MEESDGLEPVRPRVHQAGGVCTDGLPGVSGQAGGRRVVSESVAVDRARGVRRSEEHTSELQTRVNLVCSLLLVIKISANIAKNSVLTLLIMIVIARYI